MVSPFINVSKAIKCQLLTSFSPTESRFEATAGTTVTRVPIPEFAKTKGRPVIVYCVTGQTTIGSGAWEVKRPALKFWFVMADVYQDEHNRKNYRPAIKPEALWPWVTTRTNLKKEMKRYILALATTGFPPVK